MYEGLYGGFVQVTDVRGGLPRLVAKHQGLRINKSECVNDNFAFNGLDGIYNDGDGAWGELFKGLLGVDVDGGEPAAETGMGVVPAYYGLLSGEEVVSEP